MQSRCFNGRMEHGQLPSRLTSTPHSILPAPFVIRCCQLSASPPAHSSLVALQPHHTATRAMSARPRLTPLSRLLPTLPSVLLLLALSAVSFTHAQSTVSYTALTNDQPVAAYLPANSTQYFTFDAPAVAYSQQTALISVAASTGSPSLYVSLSDPLPSALSFDYSATSRTGVVVSIMSPPAPYLAYIAVQSSAYSRCNFTVVVTAYDSMAVQTTPIPLTAARPLASAIAAGEYRYYTYSVANGTVSTTIALTESYGQNYLLLNSPNSTALPTTDNAQYSSNSATFPLTALLQPMSGTWTVGVWSSQSSAFSIIAVDHVDSLSMELGVLYPGYVPLQQYSYYSIYLDAALLASFTTGSLAIELYSLDGADADLYCSYSAMHPTQFSYQWSSADGGARDSILLPVDSLREGSLYCGVFGFFATSYTFSASFGGVGITLTPGETIAAESVTGESQLYSMVFPAGNSLITLSVVSDVGSTRLFIGGYGVPPSPTSKIIDTSLATVQLLSILSAVLCGVNNSLAIPGSSPPLCQMQVSVITAHDSVYRITATTSGEFIALNPGLPSEGAASSNQSAYFTFVVPSEESNVTLLVTVTNGASGLTMQVGTQSYSTTRPMLSLSQQPGSDLLVFQLNWNSPLIPYTSIAGEYVMILTAAPNSEPATFSVVYTVSGLASTAIELLDGVPQASVPTGTMYDFYYFTPPAEGWPYTVVFNVEWTSGWGNVRVAASNGPYNGPTLYENSLLLYSSQGGTVTPNMAGVCNPTINSTCGYSISVARSVLQPDGTYSITVIAGNWLRQLIVKSDELSSSVLSPHNTDNWYTNLNSQSQAANQQLMVAVTVSSGSVTVFASNVTSSLNASSAQQTWTNVSSAAVLAFPVAPSAYVGQFSVQYIAVLCASTDATPCQYTMQAQQYVDTQQQVRLLYLSANEAVAPVTLLIPAGGMVWVGYPVWSYISIRSLIVEASATVGTPELYASCYDYWGAYNTPRPSENASTWNATTAPLAIELLNFNATAVGCTGYATIVVGVRAAGGQPAMVAVSAVLGGGLQVLSAASERGINTPAFPVSYYQYTLSNDDSSIVLSFILSNYDYGTITCPFSQLQMAVSDTVQYPDSSDPSTFNHTGRPVQLAGGIVDFSIVLSNYTQPAGSMRAGYYYVAVRSTVVITSCQFRLLTVESRPLALQVGQSSQIYVSANVPSYISLASVPYNTSTSLVIQPNPNTGTAVLFVAINSVLISSDPASYLFAVTYDTTQDGPSRTLFASPINVPASACSASSGAQLGQPCTVIVLVLSSGYTQMLMTPMSSNGSIPLLADQVRTVAATNTTTPLLYTLYQLSVPTSPVQVTLSINSTSRASVQCSYEYVTPDAQLFDWQASSSGMSSPYPMQLSFTWDTTQLRLNPNTSMAAAPTVCYCRVRLSSNSAHNISYSYTSVLAPPPPSSSSSSSSSSSLLSSSVSPTSSSVPWSSSFFSSFSPSSSISASMSSSRPSLSTASSPSSSPASLSSSSSWTVLNSTTDTSSSGLSSGALAAAVVVPVVVVLLLAVLLLVWAFRSGLCRPGSSKDSKQQQLDSDSADISMTELSSSRANKSRGGRLVQQQWLQSDTA